ncbi:MAG: RluA family pseudouridine synthase [Candidatus Jorgensenbacteria bacterium]
MFEVIYENDDFLVINKPAGVLVHGVNAPMAEPSRVRDKVGTKSGDEETVADWLVRYYPAAGKVGDPSTGSSTTPRPGIVHRLDRETSGVLVAAKTQPFFEHMKRLFQAHEVEKTYLALVYGEVKKPGVVDKPIGLRAGTVKRSVRARRMKMVKEAVTEYRPLKVFSGKGDGGKPETFTLVRLTPRTGRTHQLRVHMASIGHPVVGDALYGRKGNPLGLARHFLHAESIVFSLPACAGGPARAGTPDGKLMRFDAELPEDLEHVIDGLKEIG